MRSFVMWVKNIRGKENKVADTLHDTDSERLHYVAALLCFMTIDEDDCTTEGEIVMNVNYQDAAQE